MRAEVRRISPSDAAGYERFMAEADRCYEIGFKTLGDKAFDSLKDLIQASPAILRMRGWRSLHSMVAGHLKHPKLRQAMSLQSLLIGGNPFSVTCVYSLINALERQWGVHWAMGGTGSLVRGLVGLLGELGGSLRLGSAVQKIDIDNGRATGVTLASGERIAADIVVSNGDTAWTYKHLVDARWRRHWTEKRIDNGRYSMGLFVWYFGTKKRYDAVPHHMMVLGPRYRELLNDIFKKHKLADDFSLYLHRPTATDLGMAPPRARHLLRAVAGAAPGQRHRLVATRRKVPRCHCRDAGTHRAARPARTDHDLVLHHAAGLPRPPVVAEGRRLRAGAAAAAERLVPPAQPQRGRRGPVHGGCEHAPGCRRARRAHVGAGAGQRGARRRGLQVFSASAVAPPPRSPRP